MSCFVGIQNNKLIKLNDPNKDWGPSLTIIRACEKSGF